MSPKVDDWLPWLVEDGASNVTFETCVLPLEREEVDVLLGLAGEELLELLVNRVRQAMEPWTQTGVFVRLSCLSPKDAVVNEELVERLRALRPDVRCSYVEQIRLLNQALYDACRMETAEQVVGLLMASSRIRGHLERGKSDMGAAFSTSIILRKWYQIDPCFEFRGFVFGGRLVAVSHYYKMLYDAEIFKTRSLIQQAIEEFFAARVRDKIPLLEYVVDFVVLPRDGYRCFVIELNPWAANTSSALFSWDELEAKAASKNVECEFRVLEQPLPNVLEDQVSFRLRMLLRMAFPEEQGSQDVVYVPTKKQRRALSRAIPLGVASGERSHDAVKSLSRALANRETVEPSDLRLFGDNVREITGPGTAHSCRIILLLLAGASLPDLIRERLEDAILAERKGDVSQILLDVGNARRLAVNEFGLTFQ